MLPRERLQGAFITEANKHTLNVYVFRCRCYPVTFLSWSVQWRTSRTTFPERQTWRWNEFKQKHDLTPLSDINVNLRSPASCSICLSPGGHECLRAVISSRFTLWDWPRSGRGSLLSKKWLDTLIRTECSFHTLQKDMLADMNVPWAPG